MVAATLPESDADWQRFENKKRYISDDLIMLFNATFAHYQTVLMGGADEPLYQPASESSGRHQIHFRADYFRSALHEIAHWCVAGPERRLLEDYGYWYSPDGRNAEQQAAFEQVEVTPQAYELLFCAACGHPFNVSLDNLEAGEQARVNEALFKARVIEKAFELLTHFDERAGLWVQALQAFYGIADLQHSLKQLISS